MAEWLDKAERYNGMRAAVAFGCGLLAWVSFLAFSTPCKGNPQAFYWVPIAVGGFVGGFGRLSTSAIGPAFSTLGHAAGGLIWMGNCMTSRDPELFPMFICIWIIPLIVAAPLSLLGTVAHRVCFGALATPKAS